MATLATFFLAPSVRAENVYANYAGNAVSGVVAALDAHTTAISNAAKA